MPTREEWERIHADLMARLSLPCVLRFSDWVVTGQHRFEDDGTCQIVVNPEADFRVPEHLLLHEAAHHRVSADLLDTEDEAQGCHVWGGGHCEHWAAELVSMYAETGTPLPQTTTFFEFAKAAGIVRRNFVKEG